MKTKKKQLMQVSFNLKIVDDLLPMKASVPDARTTAVDLIPVFQKLTNQVVDHSIELTQREGKEISCKAGCGACCKQPVPVTLLEVEHLNRVVKKMPEQRQRRVRATFAHHLKVVEEAGLLEQFRNMADIDSEQRRQLATDYFELALECPFLENQSCGIYQDRPLECREFLVTSDPKYCAQLDPEKIEHINRQMWMSSALRKLSIDSQNNDKRGWVLLIFALDLAKSGRLRFKKKWAKDWLQDFMKHVTGNSPRP
jgi:Fe-S-cluster containining protein